MDESESTDQFFDEFREEKEGTLRKIVSVIENRMLGLVALCDDGTVWSMPSGRKWQKLPDIPQAN